MATYAFIDPLMDEERAFKMTAPLYKVLGYDTLVEINTVFGNLNDEKYIKNNQYIFGEYLKVIGLGPDEVTSFTGKPDSQKNLCLYNPTYDKLGRLVGYDYAVASMDNQGYIRLAKLLELDHDENGEEILIYKVDWFVSLDFWEKLESCLELPF